MKLSEEEVKEVVQKVKNLIGSRYDPRFSYSEDGLSVGCPYRPGPRYHANRNNDGSVTLSLWIEPFSAWLSLGRPFEYHTHFFQDGEIKDDYKVEIPRNSSGHYYPKVISSRPMHQEDLEKHIEKLETDNLSGSYRLGEIWIARFSKLGENDNC